MPILHSDHGVPGIFARSQLPRYLRAVRNLSDLDLIYSKKAVLGQISVPTSAQVRQAPILKFSSDERIYREIFAFAKADEKCGLVLGVS